MNSKQKRREQFGLGEKTVSHSNSSHAGAPASNMGPVAEDFAPFEGGMGLNVKNLNQQPGGAMTPDGMPTTNLYGDAIPDLEQAQQLGVRPVDTDLPSKVRPQAGGFSLLNAQRNMNGVVDVDPSEYDNLNTGYASMAAATTAQKNSDGMPSFQISGMGPTGMGPVQTEDPVPLDANLLSMQGNAVETNMMSVPAKGTNMGRGGGRNQSNMA